MISFLISQSRSAQNYNMLTQPFKLHNFFLPNIAFSAYPQDNLEPNNFAQQIGVFEVHTVLDYTYKKTMKQVVLNNPIDWCPQKLKAPINVIGSEFW